MNKATREQVLGVVEHFFGIESATYGMCVGMFNKGRTPAEVILWLQSLRQAYHDPATPAKGESNGHD